MTIPPRRPYVSLNRSQTQAQADYTYEVLDDKSVVIVDEDLGNRSVTNDIAAVLADIATQEGLPSLAGHQVIYRDSDKTWAGVQLHPDGRFADFFGLGAIIQDEAEALRRLRAGRGPAQ